MTVALTFALIGSTSYVLLERSLAHREISDYAEGQRADAKAFEREGTRATGTADEIGDIEPLLEGVEQRPGTLAVLLIDKQHVVTAAGNSVQVGHGGADARIDGCVCARKLIRGTRGRSRQGQQRLRVHRPGRPSKWPLRLRGDLRPSRLRRAAE